MSDQIIIIVGSLLAGLTWLGFALLETLSNIEIGLIEKLGGTGAAVLMSYLILRYLLKRNNTLETKIEVLHEERYRQLETQHQELVAELRKLQNKNQ
jgi:sensor histidine kinase YesM